MTEEEAERVMVESLSHSAAVSSISSENLIKKSRLHSPDLVTALNEHIHLRVQGNQLYGASPPIILLIPHPPYPEDKE